MAEVKVLRLCVHRTLSGQRCKRPATGRVVIFRGPVDLCIGHAERIRGIQAGQLKFARWDGPIVDATTGEPYRMVRA